MDSPGKENGIGGHKGKQINVRSHMSKMGGDLVNYVAGHIMSCKGRNLYV